MRIALIRVAAHDLFMTEIKGKNERIQFTFRPDARIKVERIPELIKKYKESLSFTAYGTPFFTYRYYKSGVVEKDAENLLSTTEKLLNDMQELLLE